MDLAVPASCLFTATTPVAVSSRDGVLGENGVTQEDDGVVYSRERLESTRVSGKLHTLDVDILDSSYKFSL